MKAECGSTVIHLVDGSNSLQAITKLLHLAPSSAILLTQDEDGAITSEEEVPSALIQRDDLLKVILNACNLRAQP